VQHHPAHVITLYGGLLALTLFSIVPAGAAAAAIVE
jgi:hypothetical protein